MEVELMVTKRDDDNRRRQGEYRAICLGKVGRQSFAIFMQKNAYNSKTPNVSKMHPRNIRQL